MIHTWKGSASEIQQHLITLLVIKKKKPDGQCKIEKREKDPTIQNHKNLKPKLLEPKLYYTTDY